MSNFNFYFFKLSFRMIIMMITKICDRKKALKRAPNDDSEGRK